MKQQSLPGQVDAPGLDLTNLVDCSELIPESKSFTIQSLSFTLTCCSKQLTMICFIPNNYLRSRKDDHHVFNAYKQVYVQSIQLSFRFIQSGIDSIPLVVTPYLSKYISLLCVEMIRISIGSLRGRMCPDTTG